MTDSDASKLFLGIRGGALEDGAGEAELLGIVFSELDLHY